MRPPHFFHNIVNMKHYLLIIVSLFTFSVSHAQFSSVSTNIVGWAAGNINAAVDLNVNLHNTINIPVSANPFKFGDTQWSHVVLQPGWRHWFVERYIGQFVSPSLFYANYTIGYDKRTFKGQCLRHRMLLGLLETPEYPLELHRRDRGRYRLYPLHREAAAEAHRGVRRRVYLSSPPVPARPDQMQPVIFLLVLIHRSHDNDFRKLQRI